MKQPWEQLLRGRGYFIRQTLGEGAYSKVKLAYSTDLKRDVAIKCITFKEAPNDFLCKFLPRELKILPKLRHENIAHVYEIYQNYNEEKPSNSYVCIVMEFAKNGDLLNYVQKRGALPECEIKWYFWQLCQAVKYCHSKHIAHRDLKCENLLLGKKRTLLLTDFGFCTQVTFDYKGKVNLSSTFCGSVAYAAPETLQGKPYNPFMHDMWSLGVILYVIACGEMPFDDSSVSKMLKVVLQNQIKFPSSIRSRLSSKLKSLIRLLLEVNISIRGTIDDVVSHPFFHNLDVNSLSRGICNLPHCTAKEAYSYSASSVPERKTIQSHKKTPALKLSPSRQHIKTNSSNSTFSSMPETHSLPSTSEATWGKHEGKQFSCPQCGHKRCTNRMNIQEVR